MISASVAAHGTRGRSFLHNLLGFLTAPLVTGVFVALISSLYARGEWRGTFLAVLALCYPTAVVLGIPAFWILRSRKRQELHHSFLAGLVVGILPSTLWYAITVEPVSALATLAGTALGGMTFWFIAIGRSNKSTQPPCETHAADG
jgi:4-amino-4-deoxy-L-arabinose transferase-like glycosyltransferase